MAEVVVVGNGPVGQTAALLLARWGLDVVLLDARPGRLEGDGAAARRARRVGLPRGRGDRRGGADVAARAPVPPRPRAVLRRLRRSRRLRAAAVREHLAGT